MDQFPHHQQQVEDAECRQGAADPGQIEKGRQPGRTHGQQQAPYLGPRHDDEQQADVDQVADVDDDGEKSERAHLRIVPFLSWEPGRSHSHPAPIKKEEKTLTGS